MEVDVEDLAVAAPVAAEVEQDALVLTPRPGDGGGDVGGGVGGLRVEVRVGFEETCLTVDGARRCKCKYAQKGCNDKDGTGT